MNATDPAASQARTVHVHLCDPVAQGEHQYALAWSWLDAQERQRAEHFMFARDRVEYVVAHGLLRQVLARRVGRAPAELLFRRSDGGKPELLQSCEQPSLRFNLSHARGLVGCAITVGSELGFDIEKIVDPAPLEIAERYFCRSELAGLEALDPQQRYARFYQLWTLKEAYMKGTGLGLAMPLHSFAVEPSGPHLVFAAGSASWALRSWTLPEHAVALAVQGDGSELAVECHRVEQLGSVARSCVVDPAG